MSKIDKGLVLILAILMLALFAHFVSNMAVSNYKNNCEVLGDAAGPKWRECQL
jgi:hypothetical protein